MSVLGFAAPRHHGMKPLPSFPTQHHPTTAVDTYMNALRRWRAHRNGRCCVVRFRLFHPPGSAGAAVGWMFFRRVGLQVYVCVDVWVLVQRDQLPVPLFLSRFNVGFFTLNWFRLIMLFFWFSFRLYVTTQKRW